ncbi:MAG TPA: mandelate racemase [Rhodospirillales bacterium]|jgi:L-alanine-DL-glutamate epimerase-like enolase superfamily enzyme|nr:mandelate racemase [Rhodospirillales bacterium]
MIILEIRLLRIKLPLITPYRLSYRTVEAFEPLLVEVRDADGNAGWGEGHISPGSSDETPEGGWAFCHNIAATAAGHDSDAIKASLLDSMAVSPVAAGAFVSAIDMLTGDPLLRPPAEETRLPILAPVNGLTPEALGPEIEEKLASGFRTFKIKVGKDLDGDIARTRTIQDTIAGRATMRIDANRAFSEDQAKQFAAALNPEGIELFEQPCDAEDWDANAAVAGMSPVPVMLDEPICAIADIERAATIKGVGLCKLKLKRFGTVSMLKEALDLTRELGMTPVLGDGLGTEVSCWMEACVARTTIDNAGEFNGFLKPKTRLFADPLEFTGGQVVLRADFRPRIDEDVLARHTIAEERFGA